MSTFMNAGPPALVQRADGVRSTDDVAGSGTDTTLTEFRVLGPVEAMVAGRQVNLAPPKRRSVLALLALHANRSVPVWQFIHRMWEVEPPRTAQWALRNQVSALRKAMQGNPAVSLNTVASGYCLQVPSEAVDHETFRQLIGHGRRRMDGGRAEEASRAFAEALSLWRGPVLANLRDAHLMWPEARELAELRLRTLEDRIDADLVLGRHRQLVAELEGLTRSYPWRERLWRQHMVALFRAGQQAHALAAYRDARAAISERTGQEPGKALEDVYRAILEQRAEVRWPAGASGAGEFESHVAGGLPVWPLESDAVAAVAQAPVAVPVMAPGGPEAMDELRPVTILTVRVGLPLLRGEPSADDDASLDRAIRLVAERIALHGGRLEQTIGPVVTGSFGLHRGHEDDCERAVRAALDVRAVLGGPEASPGASNEGCGSTVSVAVTAGTLLVRAATTPGRPGVVGRALDDCMTLVDGAAHGDILVTDPVYRATRRWVVYSPAPVGNDTWMVQGIRERGSAAARVQQPPLAGRTSELATLAGVLDGVRTSRRPYLLTVVGAPGIGKTRLIDELRARASAEAAPVRWYQATVPPYGDSSAARVLTLLREVTGHDAGSSDSQQDRPSIVAPLLRLAEASSAAEPRQLGELTAELRRSLRQIVPETTVLIIDDLHRGDRDLLRLVERLPDYAGWAPLLVIATARPELLTAQPGWAGGRRNSLTVTLPPLGAGPTVRLLCELVAQGRSSQRSACGPGASLDGVVGATDLEMLVRVGGNPLFAAEYARLISSGRVSSTAPPQIPELVHRVVGERLDTLTAQELHLLRMASVYGTVFPADAVSAMAGVETDQAESTLMGLEQQGFLLAVAPSEYTFMQLQDRDVVYQRIPRSAKARLHARAAEWLERHKPAPWASVARHHRREATRDLPAATTADGSGLPAPTVPHRPSQP